MVIYAGNPVPARNEFDAAISMVVGSCNLGGRTAVKQMRVMRVASEAPCLSHQSILVPLIWKCAEQLLVVR